MEKNTLFGHSICSDSLGQFIRIEENTYLSPYFLQALAKNHLYVYEVITDPSDDDYFKIYFKDITNILNR